MFRKYNIALLSFLTIGALQASDVTKASKSFLRGIIYSVFRIKKEIKFIRCKTMPMNKIAPKTYIYTYVCDDLPQSSHEQATTKKDCISDDVAYDLFSTIDTLIAFKEQQTKDAVMMKYFRFNPSNVFPRLAAIAQKVDRNSAVQHIAMPLIFFNYAFTSEFQLFYLANIIAQHLGDSRSAYHDYFCAVRKACITRDYSAIKQVYDKYPKPSLTIPDKEERQKIVNQTLSGSIRDMELVIDKMPWGDAESVSPILRKCRKKYNGLHNALGSTHLSIADKKDK